MLTTSPFIIACDFDTREEVITLAKKLDPKKCRLKIASTLFTRYGPALVTELQTLGYEIFLDLKYHDIPEQVAAACKQAAALGVWMLTLHCSGGRTMMEAAREAVGKSGGATQPLLIGVTVLTSLSTEDLSQMGHTQNLIDTVLTLGKLAKESGLDGIVCSAAEVSLLRKTVGEAFQLVTPGIRFPDDALDDQKRVAQPGDALALGSNYLVIGRPITRSPDPAAVFAKLDNLLKQ